MAYGHWPDYTPGAEYGPCEEPCQHQDCARMRDPAFHSPPCKECGEKMETGQPFYFEGKPAEPLHMEHVWDREAAG